MAEQRNKSNKKFMVLSALGILMVVDHHTWITFNFFGSFIPYNSFFMPMFVFISGYFNKVDHSTSLWHYFLKKVRTLLLPYAGISLLVFGLRFLMDWFKTGEIPSVPEGYLAYVLERVVTVGESISLAGPMWFVISLFSVLMIYAVIKKLLSKHWNSYLALAVFFALHLFSIYMSQNTEAGDLTYFLLPLKCCFFLPFLEMGIIYRDHLESIHSGLSGGRRIGLLALLLLFNMTRTMYLPQSYDTAFDALGEFAGFTSPFIVTPMVSSIVGILFWLTIVDMIGKPVYESRFVNFMSCNTFWVMGLHIAFFNILNCILLAINEHIVELQYFDTETFRESEWYYWELSPNFRLAYLIIGILGPLGLKWIFDKICTAFRKSIRRDKTASA